MKRDLLLSLGFSVHPTKEDSYRFESGIDNLTSRIRNMGLLAIVVGRDGNRYDVTDWARSRTFRLGSQDNLLVTDNQVRSFVSMSPEERLTHVRMTWGDYAGRAPGAFPDLGYAFAKGDLFSQQNRRSESRHSG
jgi:hypothetical protein